MPLLITFESVATSRVPGLARALVRAGARPVYVGPAAADIPGVHTVATASAERSILASALGAVHRHGRPGVVFVETHTRGGLLFAAQSYRRGPSVLYFCARPLSGLRPDAASWRRLAAGRLLGAAANRAAKVFAETEDAADGVLRLGVREVEIVSRGVDLSQLPLAERHEARTALGLPPSSRVVAMVGPLDDEARLQIVGLAHRRLAGVTLLVAGSGRAEGLLSALAASARPSSPVLTLGPQSPGTTVAAALAADVGLAWDAETSRAFLALGRRVVTPSDLAHHVIGNEPAPPYPEYRSVFEMDVSREGVLHALRSALEEDAAHPFDSSAIEQARARLDEVRRLNALAAFLLEVR